MKSGLYMLSSIDQGYELITMLSNTLTNSKSIHSIMSSGKKTEIAYS